MNRRGFLGMLGAAIGGATLDPEKLLWEPGKKLISIPRATNTGLFGLQYYQVSGNMGAFMGIARENFPGFVTYGDYFSTLKPPSHYFPFGLDLEGGAELGR